MPKSLGKSICRALALLLAAPCIATSDEQEPLTPIEVVESIDFEAGEAGVFGLSELVALAESSSPNLREAAAAVEASRGAAWQAGLWPNPVALGGSPQWAGGQSQYFGMLAQEIVTMGKLRLDRAAANQQVAEAEFAFVHKRFELLGAVRSGFYSILASQKRVEILEKLVGIARKSEESADKLHRGGDGTLQAVLLLDIELQKAEVALQNALVELQADKRELAAVMGAPLVDIVRVDGDLSFLLPERTYDELRDVVVSENAQVLSAMAEVERTRILLKRARVQPIPNVTVAGGYQYSVEPLNNQGLLQLDVPIPVWNRNQGNIHASRANIGKAVEILQRTQNELSQALADAVGRFRIGVQLVERYEKEIVPKADRALAITQQAYQQGHFDFLQLLQAQKVLVDAELGYVNAQESRWRAAAEISRLLQSEQFP